MSLDFIPGNLNGRFCLNIPNDATILLNAMAAIRIGLEMVPRMGIEPTRLSSAEIESRGNGHPIKRVPSLVIQGICMGVCQVSQDKCQAEMRWIASPVFGA
jgi:hypothetical protein